MKLTRIVAENFKGRTFTTELAPVTVITGPNFAGKTARLDAIMLALAGYHPRLPKRNADIFDLASGPKMLVRAEYEGGHIMRQWEVNRGSVKMTEASTHALEFPPVLLDSALYFGATDRERVNMAFACADLSAAALTPPQLRAKVKALKMKQHTPAHETALAEIAEMITEREADQTMQEWLEGLLDAMKAKASEAKAAAERMQGTVGGLTELQAGTTAALVTDTELQEARSRWEAASMALQRVEAELSEAKKRQARLDEITRLLEGNEGRRKTYGALKQEFAKLQDVLATEAASFTKQQEQEHATRERARKAGEAVKHAIELLTKAKDAAGRIPQFEQALESFKEAKAKAEDALAKLKTTTAPSQAEVDAAVNSYNEARVIAGEARARAMLAKAEKEKATAGYEEFDKLTECPLCRNCAPNWKDGMKAPVLKQLEAAAEKAEQAEQAHLLAERNLEEAFQRSREMQRAQEDSASATKEAESIRQTIKAHEASIKQVTEGLHMLGQWPTPDEAEKKLVEANIACKAAEAEAAVYDSPEYRERIEQLQEKEHELAALEGRLNAAEKAVNTDEALLSEFKGLRDGLAITKLIEDHAAAAITETAAATALQLTEEAHKQSTARRAQAASAAAAKEQADAAKAEAEATAEALKLLQAAKETMVEATFGNLLTTANQLTDGILQTPLQYRDGVIGRWDGACWISHKTFSGTEQAIAHAAISVALAAQSPLKIVLIDELGRLDATNKRKLIERVCELVKAGTIDQFIGVDTDAAPYNGSAATVTQLTA